MRAAVCEGLGFMGVELDAAKNEAGATDVSAEGARMRVMVIPTDEELMIAREVVRALGQ